MHDPSPPSPFRLRKKHGSGAGVDAVAVDGRKLVELQSLRDAVVAGLIVIAVFSMLWIALSALLNRVFPWMVVLLGLLLGFAVRFAGRGVDWRFPVLAATLALLGSLLANIVLAAANTGEIFDVSTIDVLTAVTVMTWPVFFDEVLTIVHLMYAVAAAGIAAFLSNRKLTRSDYYALRLWREEQDDG